MFRRITIATACVFCLFVAISLDMFSSFYTNSGNAGSFSTIRETVPIGDYLVEFPVSGEITWNRRWGWAYFVKRWSFTATGQYDPSKVAEWLGDVDGRILSLLIDECPGQDFEHRHEKDGHLYVIRLDTEQLTYEISDSDRAGD